VLDAADVQVASAPATSVDPAAALQQAIQTARGLARLGVVLVLPPRWNGGAAAPADDPRFRVVRLGSDPQMDSDALRLDGYHFSAGGHSRAGDIVAPAVLDIVDAPGRAARLRRRVRPTRRSRSAYRSALFSA